MQLEKKMMSTALDIELRLHYGGNLMLIQVQSTMGSGHCCCCGALVCSGMGKLGKAS